MANRQTIRCGNHTVGYVDISTVDMWHICGRFEPGPDFDSYEDAIAAVRSLQREAETNHDADWTDALELVNDFGFSIATADGAFQNIRDFQLDDDGFAEFKIDK